MNQSVVVMVFVLSLDLSTPSPGTAGTFCKTMAACPAVCHFFLPLLYMTKGQNPSIFPTLWRLCKCLNMAHFPHCPHLASGVDWPLEQLTGA